MIKTKIKSNGIYVILFISFIFLFCPLGNNAATAINNDKKEYDSPLKNKRNTTDFKFLLADFIHVYGLIKKYYIFDVEDKKLITNATRGMIGGLDPHSSYLDQAEMKRLRNFNSGNFVGIGIDAIADKGILKVISTIDDTPSYKAGIQSGDLITSVNGKALNHSNHEMLINEISGKPNTILNLTVFRPAEKKEIDFSIKRESIKLKTVKARNLEDNFCYIRIKSFNRNTAKEFQLQIEKLVKDLPDKKIAGMILDLRNNPGGIIESAVDVCSYFIKNKLIVYIQGRDPKARIDYVSKPMNISFYYIPLVVLINEGSASASEIVAGALQDYKRAMILGTKSFGKGSVQSIAILNKDKKNGIKLTTHLYYTPNGRVIQLKGLNPDIEIPSATVKFTADQNILHEKDLHNHIKNKQQVSVADQLITTNNNILLKDYQIMQALQVLKGMCFSKINNF